ncbi:hybrid sensor histidine kinase/response regulator, partial [filamentous cyanobacterium CCP1]
MILIFPFTIQILVTVSLVGYFSFKSGQRSVNTFVNQLQVKASERVTEHLNTYLVTPQQINQINADAIEVGLLEISDFDRVEKYFQRQMQVFQVSQLSYTTADGEFIGVERLNDGNFLINVVTKETGLGKLHVYNTDALGHRAQLVTVKDWNPLSEPFYTQTVQSDRPIWSSTFQWTDKPNVMPLTATHPIYDTSGQIIGVLSTDLV